MERDVVMSDPKAFTVSGTQLTIHPLRTYFSQFSNVVYAKLKIKLGEFNCNTED
jgi:hypothetical protein